MQPENPNQKESEVAMLILDKTDFRTWIISRYKYNLTKCSYLRNRGY